MLVCVWVCLIECDRERVVCVCAEKCLCVCVCVCVCVYYSALHLSFTSILKNPLVCDDALPITLALSLSSFSTILSFLLSLSLVFSFPLIFRSVPSPSIALSLLFAHLQSMHCKVNA